MVCKLHSSIYRLDKAIIVFIVISFAFANQYVKLNQKVSSAVQPRQNQIFKIESCSDIEVEITVKGQVVIESGPARLMSLKGFQEDIKKEIGNQTVKFDINFPFVYYNSNNKLCYIYLSIYGSFTDETTETAEFEFIAKPKVINDIQIVKIQNITEEPIIFANDLPDQQDKIFVLDGDILQGKQFKIQIFDYPPSLQPTNQQEEPNDLNNFQMSLPNLIFGEEGKSFETVGNKKKKKKSQQNNPVSNMKSHYMLKQKNSYLNFNLQQEVVIYDNLLMFLIENNNNNNSNTVFQICQQDISQFQSISNLTHYQFAGLNYNLANIKQKILLNNQGSFILEIHSLQPEKIKLYLNSFIESQKTGKLIQEIELKRINSYISYVVLEDIVITDYIEIESKEEINVLLEIKYYTPETLEEMTKERKNDLQLNHDDLNLYIKKDFNENIQFAYLFISENSTIAKTNSIIGESSTKLLHFMQIDPTKYDLEPILESLNNYPKVYVSIRAYDNLKRTFVSTSVEIENPFTIINTFSVLHILMIVTLSVVILFAVIYTAYRILRKKQQVKQSDEVELIHSAVHVRMSSDSGL